MGRLYAESFGEDFWDSDGKVAQIPGKPSFASMCLRTSMYFVKTWGKGGPHEAKDSHAFGECVMHEFFKITPIPENHSLYCKSVSPGCYVSAVLIFLYSSYL
jgi:hypothetical protein